MLTHGVGALGAVIPAQRQGESWIHTAATLPRLGPERTELGSRTALRHSRSVRGGWPRGADCRRVQSPRQPEVLAGSSSTPRRSGSGRRPGTPGCSAKSPPTVAPWARRTLPPSSTAETRRSRSPGFGSICVLISCLSIRAPCEWPISTKPRPSLYLAQIFIERLRARPGRPLRGFKRDPFGAFKRVERQLAIDRRIHLALLGETRCLVDRHLLLFGADFFVGVHRELAAHRGVYVEAVDRRVARRLCLFDGAAPVAQLDGRFLTGFAGVFGEPRFAQPRRFRRRCARGHRRHDQRGRAEGR